MQNDYERMIQEKIKHREYFAEDEVKLSIYQVLKGLEYIHTKSMKFK